jgi:hypothetical protein
MRTTITLDADTTALVQKKMREEGTSFKQAVNDAIRTGLGAVAPRTPYRTPTTAMGVPSINLDRALQVAAELEDEEFVRKMRLGK